MGGQVDPPKHSSLLANRPLTAALLADSMLARYNAKHQFGHETVTQDGSQPRSRHH
jgi:hypothetical protein